MNRTAGTTAPTRSRGVLPLFPQFPKVWHVPASQVKRKHAQTHAPCQSRVLRPPHRKPLSSKPFEPSGHHPPLRAPKDPTRKRLYRSPHRTSSPHPLSASKNNRAANAPARTSPARNRPAGAAALCQDSEAQMATPNRRKTSAGGGHNSKPGDRGLAALHLPAGYGNIPPRK